MIRVDKVDDVTAQCCNRSSSKRRRLMPTCFGGKTTIKQSLMSVDEHQSTVAYRSSVLHTDVKPIHVAAATAAHHNEMSRRTLTQTALNYRLVYRQCSSVRRSDKQMRADSIESRMTSVTTVSRCHSEMTSDKRHHDTTCCHDSGYEGTWCNHTSSSPQQTCHLSRGFLSFQSNRPSSLLLA